MAIIAASLLLVPGSREYRTTVTRCLARRGTLRRWVRVSREAALRRGRMLSSEAGPLGVEHDEPSALRVLRE
jgi:hypothetical protein